MVDAHGQFCLTHVSRANHIGLFKDSGLNVKHYRYYDKKSINLDLGGMIQDIKVISHYFINNDPVGPRGIHHSPSRVCPQSYWSRSNSRAVESYLRSLQGPKPFRVL